MGEASTREIYRQNLSRLLSDDGRSVLAIARDLHVNGLGTSVGAVRQSILRGLDGHVSPELMDALCALWGIPRAAFVSEQSHFDPE